MNVQFKASFAKDLRNINNKDLLNREVTARETSLGLSNVAKGAPES